MHLIDFLLGGLFAFSGITAGLGAALLAFEGAHQRVIRVLFWLAAASFGSLGMVWSATSHGYSLPTQMIVAASFAAIAAAGLTWGLGEVRNKGEERTEPKYTGTLEPKVVFSPDSPSPELQVGQSGTFFGTIGSSELLFPLLKRDHFRVETLNGRILVSARVADTKGNLAAEIIRNEWKVALPPGTWDRNYNDHSLEVKDSAGRIVLQVTLLSNTVQLQGAWPTEPPWTPGYLIVRSDPNSNGAQVLITSSTSNEWPQIEPLFKYPSDLHFGELAH